MRLRRLCPDFKFDHVTLRVFGLSLPARTVFVNVVDSLCIGTLAGCFVFQGRGQQQVKMVLTSGILGGLTIFSAFSLEAALLPERA